MRQPCEETTLGDIQACQALLAKLRALRNEAETLAMNAGEELSDGAYFVECQTERSIAHLDLTLRALEHDDTADQRRAAAERRHVEARVA